jgi:hypothetical protein
VRLRFQVQNNGFSNIIERLISALSLRPATPERRATGYKKAIFSLLYDHFNDHFGLRLSGIPGSRIIAAGETVN